ncbi:hypothetical protein MKZ38_003493 [Zalerion maritima]|uniref:DUF6590 domain-containing protein n=1 Tax=Zalerion maritima TaxID=339359 RepID=A0AAD5RYD9_9PEZI|nr:hypothetical protein MKZ38_003493 [Zalerion maritima]
MNMDMGMGMGMGVGVGVGPGAGGGGVGTGQGWPQHPQMALANQPFSGGDDVVAPPTQNSMGYQWDWSDEHGDFITILPDGEPIGYKAFQKRGSYPGPLAPQPQPRLETMSGPTEQPSRPRGNAFEQPLDDKFTYVDKPKRFFSVGRIFKTAWFEPGGQGQDVACRTDMEYTRACPAFHGERPFAKFRWFVVVRKRLHHSLCFSITTFGGKGATKTSRGRPQDFIVLHAASVPAPAPDPEEKISRDPIGVIIEDGEQNISPFARLDCGRLYTVEDNLRVMKVGRVHPEHLQKLEHYFQESAS